MVADIAPSVAQIAHARKRLRRWMKPERRPVRFPLSLFGARAAVEFQPKGVIGIIAPWNFPVQMAIGPLSGALAAGNRAMIKTSEFTPRTSKLFEDVIPQYFAGDEVALVTAEATVGRAFAELPFDHLLFTGSTGIGRHIPQSASANLTPVTLELGGKSPVIVGRGADIGRIAERVALGKLLNASQLCLAPDYLMAPRGDLAEVRQELGRRPARCIRPCSITPTTHRS